MNANKICLTRRNKKEKRKKMFKVIYERGRLLSRYLQLIKKHLVIANAEWDSDSCSNEITHGGCMCVCVK